jgi:hypothetical protein
MHKARTGGAALTAFIIAASSAWGGTAPDPGKYLATIAVRDVDGAKCIDRVGAVYHGVVTYPGLDGTRWTIRVPLVFDGFSVIEREVLTITMGAGSLNPRGTFKARLSAPIDLGLSGRFEAKLTLSDDPESFKIRLTETAPSIGCTAVFEIALILSG